MLFHQFRVPGLAHCSYALGCSRTGTAAIVDPERHVETYLAFAETERVRITHVLETHIHADYASGSADLAARTGAERCLSAYDLGETHRVKTPHRRLHEDETIEVGPVRLRVLHTPGHTPEHVAYLVHDLDRSPSVPVMLLTGDLLFAGAVGRPDLAGADRAPALARQLRGSLMKLETLPDGLALYPAHGEGSVCASGAIGGSATTLGYERATNPLLRSDLTEEEFVDLVLSSLPAAPGRLGLLRELNCGGLPGVLGLDRLDPVEFRGLAGDGCEVIDVRSAANFGAGHVPGSLWLGAGPLLSSWAAWVVPGMNPLLLVANDEAQAGSARRDLARVGIDDVRGWIDAPTVRESGLFAASLPGLAPDRARRMHVQGETTILDVRPAGERGMGRIEGSHHVPGAEIASGAVTLERPRGGWTLVCRTGYVSTVAASLLLRAGHTGLGNLQGGMLAWAEAGLPVLPGEDRA